MDQCITRPTIETSHATMYCSLFFSRPSGSLVGRIEGENCGGNSSVEEQIKKSKSHWSQVVKFDLDEEVAEVSNVEFFKALQDHHTWGNFFKTFGEGGQEELVMGEKFTEGGQVELYEAQIEWNNLKMREFVLKHQKKHVLKVFKKGTFLRHLQSQWQHGMLQDHVEQVKCKNLGLPPLLKLRCHIICGTLLKDGRFAFVLEREQDDLCNIIDGRMLIIGKDDGPFSKVDAELIMYSVACGMDSLHNHNIVHRDLKASNVLYSVHKGGWYCLVANYECSIGVVGTWFFRAPEILQACKDKTVNQRSELFTKEADVYSYGMTCYEILIGKLPFEGHPWNDFDLLLERQRLELPKYVDGWVCELLSRCWQSNPNARPSFREILRLLLANSAVCRKSDLDYRRRVELAIRSEEEKLHINASNYLNT